MTFRFKRYWLAAKIEFKADIADVDRRLALKADKIDTYTKTDIVEFLDGKADKTAVTAGLNLKMNISNAYDKTEINDSLDVKAESCCRNRAKLKHGNY